MTLTVKHQFVSAIPDDPVAAAAGEVLTQSHWNATHTVTGTVGPSVGARTLLTANQNYYVAVGGSDSNSGLSFGAAWATLTHAMHFIASILDVAAFTITVNIGAGVFVGFGTETTLGGGIVQFLGAGIASTTIKDGPNDGVINSGQCFSVQLTIDSVVHFDALTFKPAIGGGVIFDVSFATAFFGILASGGIGIAFDCTNSPAACVDIEPTAAGCLLVDFGPVTVVGGGGTVNFAVLAVEAAGSAYIIQGQWAITGTLNCTNAVVVADSAGSIGSFLAPAWTGAGVTGVRFHVSTNSGIYPVEGQPGTLGPNFFPGSLPGFCDSSSSYDGFVGSSLGNFTIGGYPQSTTSLRTVLTANTNFYVATTGSDSNSGSITSKWATLQHASDFITNSLDCGVFSITINVGVGTFSHVVANGMLGFGGGVLFLGAGTSTTITGVGGGACFAISCPGGNFYEINGFNLAPVAGSAGIQCITGVVFVDTITVTIPAGGGISCLLSNIEITSEIFTDGSQTITVDGASGGTNNQLWNVRLGAAFNGANWVMVNTPKLNPAVTIAGNVIMEDTFGPGAYTGAATGKRFAVNGGGIILDASSGVPTAGTLGPNFFPGNSPGTFDASSYYDGIQGTNDDYQQPITGFTITMNNGDTDLIIDPAGTLATGTVKMAAGPVDGQKVTIRSSQIITTLTINGNGNTVVGAPTTIGVGGVLNAIFKASNTTWYF